ncbi:MAG: transcription initiation factor IIB [Candidatus Hadarchaeum sp.]|uniref:transcription initiation factor IIB n=1 Tax=Candidatus Hadarchaeum sp. TaxID=2883567 RepID=UPI003D0A61E3
MHCPLCSSTAVLYDDVRGERICTRCGFVILERLYAAGPEGRMEPGENRERADLSSGFDLSQHDYGLGSRFSVSRDLPPSERARLRRMQVLHQRARVMDWEDRSLREVLLDLDKLCEDLSLSKGIKVEISTYYRKARAKRLTSGRSAQQILAALILTTCRLRGIPRTDQEIANAVSVRFGQDRSAVLKGIRRYVKLFARELGLKLPRLSADSFIDRFTPQLELSQEAVVKAHEILKLMPRSFVQGKPPLFLAAVAIYCGANASGERVTLKRVARTLGVGVSSLSSSAAEIRNIVPGV